MVASDWRKPWYDDPWQIGIALLYVAMAFCSLWVFLPPGWYRGTDTGNVFTLLGAVATTFTGIVAVWLGLSARSREREIACDRARLAAAKVQVILQRALDRFYLVASSSLSMNPLDARDKLRTHFEDQIEVVDTETALLLAPLPEHCATRIVRAFFLLEQSRDKLLLAGPDPEYWQFRPDHTDRTRRLVERVAFDLVEAVQLLTLARDICSAESAAAIPRR